jgi:hypothetical protein
LLERGQFHQTLSIGEEVGSAHPTLMMVLWWVMEPCWLSGPRGWGGG